MFRNQKIPYNDIAIQNIKIEDSSVVIEGAIVSSALNYSKYTYEVRDNNLYITLYGKLVTSPKQSKVTITIAEPNVQGVFYEFDGETTEILL